MRYSLMAFSLVVLVTIGLFLGVSVSQREAYAIDYCDLQESEPTCVSELMTPEEQEQCKVRIKREAIRIAAGIAPYRIINGKTVNCKEPK